MVRSEILREVCVKRKPRSRPKAGFYVHHSNLDRFAITVAALSHSALRDCAPDIKCAGKRSLSQRGVQIDSKEEPKEDHVKEDHVKEDHVKDQVAKEAEEVQIDSKLQTQPNSKKRRDPPPPPNFDDTFAQFCAGNGFLVDGKPHVAPITTTVEEAIEELSGFIKNPEKYFTQPRSVNLKELFARYSDERQAAADARILAKKRKREEKKTNQ
ncbi:unnamed protein product [Sphagnum jensenii]|uniref:Uncharacterized protein n=2 Tax=Sphagnum jensenii TaxID=128206 RepID=A0ABP0VI68_9BRYO